jgi:lactoylglutathione lyase
MLLYYEEKSMKEITGINHVGLRVRDLDVSRDFYEMLGFNFIVGPVGPEPVAIVEHPSGVNFNLILNASNDAPSSNVLMDEPIKYPGYTHIALEVTDVKSMAAKILALGLIITEEIEFKGAQFFFIRDPDNNVIEFHQPANQ